MRKFRGSILYFFKEAGTIFRLNGFSTLLSVISLFLIFFISLLALGGWHGSQIMISQVRNEADIGVYYENDLGQDFVNEIKTSVEAISGVDGVRMVDAEEARKAMVEILGDEAAILEIFEENPLDPYLEVDVALENTDSITDKIGHVQGVTHVRDNKTILETLSSISKAASLIGLIVLFSVAISAPVITAHVIRSGIFAHSDHIQTMRLLGAPGWYVGFPFLVTGIVTTLSAAIPASILYFFAFRIFSGIIRGSFLTGNLESYGRFNGLLVVSLSLYALLAGSAAGLTAFRRKYFNNA